MQYKCISRGFTGRKLVPIHFDTQSFVDQKPDSDYYEGLYFYKEEHKQQFEKTGSLAGITGVKTNKLVFDFDSKTDIELARKDAVEMVSRLQDLGLPESTIQIYSSGNKGYHIELLTDQEYTRPEFEATLKNLAGDLSTLDLKVTDEQRLFRLSLTKHQVTHLFKVPLTFRELSEQTSSTIQANSKELKESHLELLGRYEIATLPAVFNEYKKAPEPKKKEETILFDVLDKPDFSKKPKFLTPAKFALQEGFFEAGERHNAFMILASTYRAIGFNEEHAYNMLKATNRVQSRRTGQEPFSTDELWLNIIKYVYSDKWKGGAYSDNQDAMLQKIKQKYGIQEQEEVFEKKLVTLGDVGHIFTSFAQNIDQNTIKLGLPGFDDQIRVTTSTLVALLAAPGAGKTSSSFSVLNSVSRNGENAIFFSLDMGSPLVYQRLIQRHTGLQLDNVFDIYKRGDKKKIEHFNKILTEEYSNVRFCFKSGTTTEDIREIMIEEHRAGRAPKLIVIDYLECIQGPFTDTNANKALIAQKLKDIGNEFNVCVFLLVQPPKVAGDPSYPLNSYRSIKGSSVLEEQCSQIFSMYRPGYSPTHPEDDNYVTFTVLKNRMGILGTFDYGWEGLTGKITTLSEEQVQDLKALRKQVEAARSAENKGFTTI